MKSIVGVLLLVSLFCVAKGDTPGAVTLPKTCEDLLPSDRCDQLRNIATAVKAKASEVEDAVRRAVAKGATSVNEIYAKAVEFFRTRIQTLTCDDLLSSQQCSNLRNMANVIHEKSTEANEAVRDALLRGYKAGQEMYAKAIDFFKNKVHTMTCADILPADRCERLEGIRVAVKAKAADLQIALADAVAKGMQTADDVYKKAIDFFTVRMTSMTCADILSSERCSRLSVVATNLKGQMSLAEERIKAAILAGKTKATELYNTAVEYFKSNVASKTCDDLLSADQCTKLRTLATDLKLKAGEFRNHVVNALASGVSTAVSTYEMVKEYLKTQVTCEGMLGVKTCSALRSLASKASVSVAEVDRLVRESLATGIGKLADLYKSVLNYLTGKILGRIDPSRARRSVLIDMYKDLKSNILAKVQKAKEMLTQAVAEVLDAFNIADAGVRAIIEQAILEGKARLATVKASVKDMLDKLISGTPTNSTAIVAKYRRDLRDDMTQALSKVRDALKPLIEKLLAKSNDALLRLRDFIESALKKINGGISTRDVGDDFEEVRALIDAEARAQIQQLADETEANAEALIRDTVEESERDIDVMTASFHHLVQRRDLADFLVRKKIEFILGLSGKLSGDVKAQVKELLEKNRTAITDALRQGFDVLISVLTGLVGV